MDGSKGRILKMAQSVLWTSFKSKGTHRNESVDERADSPLKQVSMQAEDDAKKYLLSVVR